MRVTQSSEPSHGHELSKILSIRARAPPTHEGDQAPREDVSMAITVPKSRALINILSRPFDEGLLTEYGLLLRDKIHQVYGQCLMAATTCFTALQIRFGFQVRVDLVEDNIDRI